MFKRCYKYISILVCLVSVGIPQISPLAYATWSAESFTGQYDGLSTYEFEPPVDDVSSSRMKFNLLRSASTTSETTQDLSYDFDAFKAFISPYSKNYIALGHYEPSVSTGSIYVPSSYYWETWPADGSPFSNRFDSVSGDISWTSDLGALPDSFSESYGGTPLSTDYFSYPFFDYRTYTFYSGFSPSETQKFYYEVDLSSLDPFTTFGLTGVAAFRGSLCNSDYSYIFTIYPTSVSVYVNGSVVKTFSASGGVVDFGEFVYTSSTSISSFYFVLDYTPQYLGDSLPDAYHCYQTIDARGYSNPMSFTILSDNSALDGYNDETQQNINDHSAVESQWTGSMTDNFNSLSLDTFTFPSGLVSGFGLITGIFNDLWNSMGEYRITYVFPLTLALALLIIGRISKFSGGQSSSKKDRGDSSA